MRLLVALLLAILMSWAAFAQEAIKGSDKTIVVPYKLTRTQHILVRAKFNGKGPFNLIVDTGCPVLVLSTEAAKTAGLESKKGMAVIERFEIEGGLVRSNVKARVETPFQIEGMNAMGLPGAELHGLLGYDVLAHYKMDIDFTKRQMLWTPLEYDPPPITAKRDKNSGNGGIELMGGLLKVVAKMTGLKPLPPASPQGFVGLEIEGREKAIVVKAILDGSPAAVAGLKTGDVIEKINKTTIQSLANALSAVESLRVGQETTLQIRRGEEAKTIKVKAGSGL